GLRLRRRADRTDRVARRPGGLHPAGAAGPGVVAPVARPGRRRRTGRAGGPAGPLTPGELDPAGPRPRPLRVHLDLVRPGAASPDVSPGTARRGSCRTR